MNILFLVKSFGVGGVEVVTSILANKFAKEGNYVSVFSMIPLKDNISDRLNGNVKYYEGRGYNNSTENVDLLRNIYINNNIQIVINQWGLPFLPMKPAYKASIGLNIKFVSFYHNDPLTNGKVKSVELDIENSNNTIKKILLTWKLRIVKKLTSMGMRYVYNHSDKYIVLSPSYINNLQENLNIGPESKQGVLTNPVTIEVSNYYYSFNNKKKEIVYCGRIDYKQKRVFRLIDSWALLEKDFPDWQLTIVGDGESRNDLERQVNNLELNHVNFVGFQLPTDYYKRASILALTSEYEGFPLVLAECMSFGVVPIVYGSYSAVYDIISNDVNGIIVPPIEGKFHSEIFSQQLRSLILNDSKRERLALNAIETSKTYSIDNIYKKWLEVFSELLKRN